VKKKGNCIVIKGTPVELLNTFGDAGRIITVGTIFKWVTILSTITLVALIMARAITGYTVGNITYFVLFALILQWPFTNYYLTDVAITKLHLAVRKKHTVEVNGLVILFGTASIDHVSRDAPLDAVMVKLFDARTADKNLAANFSWL